MRGKRVLCGVVSSVVSCVALAQAGRAETMNEALARAYLLNPQLNAQRANTRGVDENLPIARGTFLPTLTAQGSAGIYQHDVTQKSNQRDAGFFVPGVLEQKSSTSSLIHPTAGAVVVNFNIFNGFRSVNGIDQAEAQIRQSRQALRNTELSVLHAGAVAYMDVLRDIAIYDLRDNYVRILANQVDITKQWLQNGVVTETDVYQAETALALANRERSGAYVKLQTSISVYRQLIGRAPGKKLAPPPPLDKILPPDVDEALRRSDADHPLALAAKFNVDVNAIGVKLYEGKLAPTVDLSAYVATQNYSNVGTANQLNSNTFAWQQTAYLQNSTQRTLVGGASVQVNMPLYEGGIVYGGIRQAKEKLSEARFLQDQQIDQIHQTVEAAWAAWKESDRIVNAAKEQVRKAEATVRGMRDEAVLGQRTTWDILNAQLMLVNARVGFVTGQRDRVVSSYTLLAAMGELSVKALGLDVPVYDPADNYDRVKFQWIGTEPWK